MKRQKLEAIPCGFKFVIVFLMFFNPMKSNTNKQSYPHCACYKKTVYNYFQILLQITTDCDWTMTNPAKVFRDILIAVKNPNLHFYSKKNQWNPYIDVLKVWSYRWSFLSLNASNDHHRKTAEPNGIKTKFIPSIICFLWSFFLSYS